MEGSALKHGGSTAKWRAIRKGVLARDGGLCTLGLPGCMLEATEVDHITARVYGGDDDEDNLRSLCTECHKQVTAAQRKGRPAIFGQEPRHPRLHVSNPSPLFEPAAYEGLLGHTKPRVSTPMGTGPSRGRAVVELAERIGLEALLPWQAYALDHALVTRGVGAPGRWLHPVVGLVVGRQTGKTRFVLVPRIMAGLLEFRERRIIHTAQDRALPREILLEMVELIDQAPDAIKRRFKPPRLANGSEALTTVEGNSYKIVAPTTKAARGSGGDLVIIDESQELKGENGSQVYAAFKFTQRAKPNPQRWLVGTPGDDESVVLNRARAQALQAMQTGDRSIGWMEWSGHPDRGVLDPEGWQESTPSLGYIIRPETLYAEAREDPETFRVEALCHWLSHSLESPWPAGSWEAAEATGSPLSLDAGPVVLAVDLSPDRRTGALVAAQAAEGDQVHVALLKHWSSDTPLDDLKVAGDVAATYRSLAEPRPVMFNKYAAGNVSDRLVSAGIPTQDVSGAEFAQACDSLLSTLSAGRLSHNGDPVLTEHMGSAAKRPMGDGAGWRIVRLASAGPVAGACALAEAVYGAVNPQAEAAIHVG